MIKSFSHVWRFATPWTIACQAPLPMRFFGQEYWNKLPFPPPGDFPDPGIKPTSPVSPALAGGFFTTETTWKAPVWSIVLVKSSISLLIFCLNVLYIIESRVLEISIIFVLSNSFFNSVNSNFCHLFRSSYVRCRHICYYYLILMSWTFYYYMSLCSSDCLKDCFTWCKYEDLCSFLETVCIERFSILLISIYIYP